MNNILDINLMPKNYSTVTLRELIFSYDYELKGTDLICVALTGYLLFFGLMFLNATIFSFNYTEFFNFIYISLLLLFIFLYLNEKYTITFIIKDKNRFNKKIELENKKIKYFSMTE